MLPGGRICGNELLLPSVRSSLVERLVISVSLALSLAIRESPDEAAEVPARPASSLYHNSLLVLRPTFFAGFREQQQQYDATPALQQQRKRATAAKISSCSVEDVPSIPLFPLDCSKSDGLGVGGKLGLGVTEGAGVSVGSNVGSCVGREVGRDVGIREGAKVGVGREVGTCEGLNTGMSVGIGEG
jgi:hypothetical protein